MVEVALKPDVYRPGWYADETQFPTSEGYHWRIAFRPHVWRPPTDVYETETSVVVRVEIAGMRESDFSVSLEDRLLVIRGTRPDTSERRAFHQMEIPFGEFSTEIDLPVVVDLEGIEAIYRDGFLQIILPKAKSQHIQVGD